MSPVLTQHYPARPTVEALPKEHDQELVALVTKVEWMLTNLRKQFERLTDEKPKPTMLTPILPDQVESMRRVEELLVTFRDALQASDRECVSTLFDEIVDYTNVPPWHPQNNPVQDPRTYYWQIISWYADFAVLRTEKNE